MVDNKMMSSSRHRRSFLLSIFLFPSSSLSISIFCCQATTSRVAPLQLHLAPWASAATTAFHCRHRRHSLCKGVSHKPCNRYYLYINQSCHARQSHAVSLSAYQQTEEDQDVLFSVKSPKPKQPPQLQQQKSLLSLPLQELSDKLQGSGRALAVWDCLRLGLDPNVYYSPSFSKNRDWNGKDEDIIHHDENATTVITLDGEDEIVEAKMRDGSDAAIYDSWIAATASMNMPTLLTPDSDGTCSSSSSSSIKSTLERNTRMIILPGERQNFRGRSLGYDAWNKLQKCMALMGRDVQPTFTTDVSDNIGSSRWEREHQNGRENGNTIYTIDNSIASLSHMIVSPDGTTKMLLKMKLDGLEVESVIIPWMDKGFSTLCVSSQVGCRQGCTFCATGRMGKLRSLTADEILVQVYYASKVCRISSDVSTTQGDAVVRLPKVDNIVFMGMGEPADNAHAVLSAVQTMVDRSMFGLAQSKITISTVAPDPSAFATLGQASAALAWSVHAVDDALRRRLVPTTKYSMEELRIGLVNALQTRANKLRRAMLEVALIEGVNDSDTDAKSLAQFSRAIMNDVNGSKVVVNLIPYNAIDHPTYCAPSKERVLEFQKIITDSGVFCYVRTTRGDDESAACGQLATKKRKPAESERASEQASDREKQSIDC